MLYVAHPLRPTDDEIAAQPAFLAERGRNEYELDHAIFITRDQRVKLALVANLQRAMRWLTWLRRSFPDITFVAPWIASCLAGDDDRDPALREAGIADAVALIPRLDGVVLVGGRMSSGMWAESDVAGYVVSLIGQGTEPPSEVPWWLAVIMRKLAGGGS